MMRWDERYAGEDYLFGTEPNAFLKSQAYRLEPGQRALAVADGEGRNGVFLAETGLAVTSIDASERGLAKARALAAARGVALDARLADVINWDWPQADFDVAVAIFIQFADPSMRAILFDRMQAALRPGGLLILQGYRPEQVDYGTGGPPQRENMYTRALLEEAFADLDILHLEEHDSEIFEGSGHGGRSALIDLVARRSSV
ncbi:cyclopropane-fatty-acyl-phospholipid synthase family protein [Aurantimonas sp. VKM B-3413]|uniref:SAM-dependent methyltransferase n=1 Tax=Aurantimonas sp. VKM B-3413 TaxID=2779401 RepID=UPI001E49E179|nr:class I SAM-dependent methyltransferase [Aurantimonas sp. VKM B-3413]MCB8839908.1 methyltransferase domain-containing protein [Aurantimonas sp. VKM B-3413]